MTAPVVIRFLGGLGEVGRNCTCVEVDGKLLLIDFGLMFPDATMPGVDVILPDTSWLKSRADDVLGLVITHAHEDHVGGVAYFLREFEAPIYGSSLAMAIANSKIEWDRLSHRTSLHVLADNQRLKIGPFDIEVIPITHSVPQSFCVLLHTSQGVIVHTGDFKLDETPVDNRLTNTDRLRELASGPGVRLLMADSTNADSPGHSESESSIGRTFERIFPTYSGKRMIIGCFASHLHRVQQIVDVAISEGRKIFPLGRSMVNNVRIAQQLGILNLSSKDVYSIEDIDQFEPGEICIVCTGSQGEPNAALSLLASNNHRDLRVTSEDVVILSSHPIPGNERAVYRIIDRLTRMGCEVVHDGHELVHTSGHAKREELSVLQSIVKPEWFVPIEGEFRMLQRHADLAIEAGMSENRVIVVTDGAELTIDEAGVSVTGGIPAPYRFIDGLLDDVSYDVLEQRRSLSQSGFVHVSVVVSEKRTLVSRPEIATKGWIDQTKSVDILASLEVEVTKALERALDSGVALKDLERLLRRTTGRFVGDHTRRRPPILSTVFIID
ncbi:MAG: ribonuclease J [Candidatus Poriferisodalaceae bacterium]|jgi:ribonuclease J